MNHLLPSIEVVALTKVTGGQQRPQPVPPPTQESPPRDQQPQQRPQRPQPQQPLPADETGWIRNTVRCARVGGPVLGALCGILTPTPAN